MSEAVSSRPHESFRPDRFEVVSEIGQVKPVDLAPGVLFDCLVGRYNGARRLTTGIASLSPGARIPYHTDPVSESLTVLSGSVAVEVEGREYALTALDNIVTPREVPHTVYNYSSTEAARVHLAWATNELRPRLVTKTFERRPILQSFSWTSGKEYVTRFATAPRSAAGPGTSFIDHFNEELIPGIEMSGGYGLFHPGGRLPAHFHDFDESICIIDGEATCICEGRRHVMSGGATALQPRGRVHYFINESDKPMAMLWVYAGPLPERIEVEEQYASTPGAAWGI